MILKRAGLEVSAAGVRTSASCAGASCHAAHTAPPSPHSDLAVSQRSPAGALSPETTALSPLYTHTNTRLSFIIHISILLNKAALTLIILELTLDHSDHKNREFKNQQLTGHKQNSTFY